MSGTDIGNYRLQRVLSQLEDMATLAASPRSPLFNHALHYPIESLPVTRFPQDERLDMIHEVAVETQKEREVIQSQPYRTTQLIFPGVKPRSDLVCNKLTGKPSRPTSYRPLDEKSVVAKLNENQALVNRQFNSPGSLYSQQNVNEAVYQQTGVNLAPPVGPVGPIEFNPAKSPTFQALIEEEQPVRVLPAPHVQRNAPPQKYAHATAPSSHLNSVGQPAERIAQSGSFRRLMLQVLGE